MRFLKFSYLGLALWLAASCRPSYHLASQQYRRIGVDSTTARPDVGLNQWLATYRDRMGQTMNEVLFRTTTALDKGKPESVLTDILTDALLVQARLKYGKPIDLAHLNYGGVRSGLPKGNVTVSNIFEVMPFDNQLVVLTLTGDQLGQFLRHFAEKDDALLISGARVALQNGQLRRVTLDNGRAIAPDQTYTVAMSDYVAGGGSDATFLKSITQRENSNYLIRDAFLDYFRNLGGKPLMISPDGRITIE